ncbi:unnamed protein product [Anisakis simplex]|uniref:LNS2 domain-containing protein n=1 Tax=Anisakis simplex TaxID=6269 RepID=A0A0M3K8C6_ANISI|nr:unnamed protein product [Anisakis simplex]
MKSKKSLPFNASLFSQRRYRSLPNLSELVEASNLDTTDNLESNLENDVPLIVDDTNKDQFKMKQQQVKKDGRSKIFVDPTECVLFPVCPSQASLSTFRRLTHSRSTVDNRSLTPPPHTTRRKKQLLDRERRDRNAKLSTKKAKLNKLNKDQGNKDELEDTLSSTSSLSSGTSNPSAENDGYIMFGPKGEFGRQQSQQSQANIQSPKMHDLDNIADGAVSDSEVDRHRNAPQPHGSDVTEWKWGEIPKTRDDEKAEKELRASAAQKATEKTKKEETSWSDWFRWSKPKLTEDQGIYLDDLVENSLHDPSKIEKYLGKSSSAWCVSQFVVVVSFILLVLVRYLIGNFLYPSPPYDSGNASSTASCAPNSPQSLSVDTDEPATAREPSKEASTAREDKTPTEEHPPENVHPSKDLTDIVGQHQPRPVSSSENRQEETMKKLDNGRKRRQSGRSTSPSSDILHFCSAMSDEETNIPGTSSPPHTEDVTQQQSPTYIRSLRLPSEKLKKLPLKKGANEARFSITTKFQGTCWCSCHIYLYRWSEQLVISDIDGTITKSDVLGHVIPAIGGQWAHAGVAELYTRIAHNGYKMVYLSSRAIGQSYYTKKYLQSIAQDTRVLPDGPLLLSPTSVLMAFRREVIDRCPEDFKIAALSDLKECFPVEQPFYAGFGNRPNDVIAYRHVGVRPDRILIINKEGRVRREDGIGFETSYMSMALDIVDYMFPPLVTQPKHLNLAVEADNVGRKIYRLKQSFPEALKFRQ